MKNNNDKIPMWMLENKQFCKELSRVTNHTQYEKLIMKFGISYIISTIQVGKILTARKNEQEIIITVKAAVTEFWAKRTEYQSIHNQELWTPDMIKLLSQL